MKTRKLDSDEISAIALPALLSLFTSKQSDSYGTPIRSDIPIRSITFDTGIHLTIDDSYLMKALVDIATSNNENGFYVCEIGSKHQDFFFIPIDGADNYWEHVERVEHVFFSQRGDWGFVFSYESHGLLAMKKDSDFKIFKKYIIDLENQVRLFIDYWEYYKPKTPDIDFSWFSAQLIHMYGEDQAKALLEGKNI